MFATKRKKLYSPIASLRETFSKSRFADGTAVGAFFPFFINTKADGNATFEDLVNGLEKIRDALLSDYDIMLTIGLDGVISEM